VLAITVHGTEELTVRIRYRFSVGRATAQAVSRWLPTAAAQVRGQVMRDLRWTKWHWGRFSPSTSVSPANLHSTKFRDWWPMYQVDSVSLHPKKLS
jgi:hypothetical protein